jgi:hypothetical protein
MEKFEQARSGLHHRAENAERLEHRYPSWIRDTGEIYRLAFRDDLHFGLDRPGAR